MIKKDNSKTIFFEEKIILYSTKKIILEIDKLITYGLIKMSL